MVVSVTEITLSPSKAQLLHRLAAGQQLLRQPSTLRFIVGTPHEAYVSVLSRAAETLIDYRLVDNQGPVSENMSAPTLFLINDRGSEWCALNPQGQPEKIGENDAGQPTAQDLKTRLSEQAQDMLLNAQPRVGGLLGIGDEDVLDELRRAGFIGERDCLTRRGFQAAQVLQHDRWGS